MTDTAKLVPSCTEYLLCVRHCEIHAELPNSKRIQAMLWPSEFSAYERYKQVTAFPGTSGLLPRILTYIKVSGIQSVSQSMSGGLLVLQGVNSLIHKQRVSLMDHIWNSLGKQDSTAGPLISLCEAHGRVSQIQPTRTLFTADHLTEDEELSRIYLEQCWSALSWVRNEHNISRACLVVFPLISFSYTHCPQSPSDFMCRCLPSHETCKQWQNLGISLARKSWRHHG